MLISQHFILSPRWAKTGKVNHHVNGSVKYVNPGALMDKNFMVYISKLAARVISKTSEVFTNQFEDLQLI